LTNEEKDEVATAEIRRLRQLAVRPAVYLLSFPFASYAKQTPTSRNFVNEELQS
jgi:hypothetical protein